MRHQRAAQPLQLDNLDAARTFFAGCFAESDPARECLWVAHLDRQLFCIGLSQHEGDRGGSPLPVRSIVADAAVLESSGLLLAHNHPSGDANPSRTDCLSTRKRAVAARTVGCNVLDHLVFKGGRFTSFRKLGLL